MRNIAYVACSRGREDIEVFVESIADLSQIQNRSGDRKAAVEMAFGEQPGGRAEAKELFRHLQRIRAAKEPVEHVRTVDLCRQADEALKPSEKDREQNRSVDLQEHAIRNAQEAARRTETHERHDDLDQVQKRQQGRGREVSLGM